MVILRATRKLHPLLPEVEAVSSQSDTALGDWYVNRIMVSRQPLLLLVSSTSLLSILLPARDVRGLPDRLATHVSNRLKRCGIDDEVIADEIRAMKPVVVQATVNRSVLGIMVDFAKAIPYYFESRKFDDATFDEAEVLLAENPCHVARSFDRVIFPARKAPELLYAKWLGRQAT